MNYSWVCQRRDEEFYLHKKNSNADFIRRKTFSFVLKKESHPWKLTDILDRRSVSFISTFYRKVITFSFILKTSKQNVLLPYIKKLLQSLNNGMQG